MYGTNRVSASLFTAEEGSDGILERALLDVSYPIVMFKGVEQRVAYINNAMLQLWGKDRNIIGQTYLQVLPELEDQPFPALLDKVFKTGIPQTDKEALAYLSVNGITEAVYFDYSYTAVKTGDGAIVGVMVICRDVTEQVLAKRAAINSEAKFRNTILQAPVAIAVLQGPEFILETANDKSLEMWLKSDEVIGKKLEEVFPEYKAQGFIDILERVFQTGEAFYGNEVAFDIFHEEGFRTVYSNFVYEPIYENGNVNSILALGYDVTELVLSRKEAEKREALLEFLNFASDELALSLETDTALKKISDLIVPKFSDLLIIDMLKGEQIELLSAYGENEAYIEAFIESRKTLNIQDLGPWVQVLRTAAPALNTAIDLENLRESLIDEAYSFKNRKMNFRSSIIVPMKIGSHTIGLVTFISNKEARNYGSVDVEFAKDFATRVALTLENARLHEMQHEAIRTRDEFLSIASHELNTPLTTVNASIQMLMRVYDRQPQSDAIPHLMNTSYRSTVKLNRLVQELLDFSRIEAGQLILVKKVFDLSALAKECCSFAGLTTSHAITFKGDLTLKVFADRHRIDQVIVNLVNNAVKYSPNATEIVVLVQQQGDNANVSVIDKGQGIEESKIPHLFDRYYRASYAGLQFSGLGLGLYICENIIKLHGGTIGVTSKPEVGSTFWFNIPITV